MSVNVDKVDKRTVTVRFPAGAFDLISAMNGMDDYKLTGASLIQGGHQMDPVAVGVKLVFTRD